MDRGRFGDGASGAYGGHALVKDEGEGGKQLAEFLAGQKFI
ncbi:hypothetical protein SMICM304S_06530 [Streptomyces microflavus]